MTSQTTCVHCRAGLPEAEHGEDLRGSFAARDLQGEQGQVGEGSGAPERQEAFHVQEAVGGCEEHCFRIQVRPRLRCRLRQAIAYVRPLRYFHLVTKRLTSCQDLPSISEFLNKNSTSSD